MTFVFTLPLFILAITGCALAVFLAAEVAAAAFPKKKRAGTEIAFGPVAVVIPAHNEAPGINATLTNILGQLRPDDYILVVADNCTDETAQIARSCGAKTLERHDPNRRGKGFALQFALDHLRAAPPEIVVFSDADCQFAPDALQHISSLSASEQRPVQALYLMKAPSSASPRLQVAEFAWAFMNNVRMRGMQNLFGVTRFTGAGFAAPWRILADVQLASGEIVEDLAFTLQLLRKGAPPMLAPDAVITSQFPTDEAALMRQSARWSIGSLRFAAREAARSLFEGIRKGRLSQIGASIDFMTPPLTVFAAALFVLTGLGLLAWLLFGAPMILLLSLLALTIFSLTVIAGWFCFGRKILPLSAAPGIVSFLFTKTGVYGAKGRESAKRWTPTRTAGTDSDD